MQMNVLITGATGLVATELILTLLNNSDHSLFLTSRNKDLIQERYRNYQGRIKVLTLQELKHGHPIQIDICVHTAFARSSEGNQLTSSLTYLFDLCEICKELGVKKFINISSQSVYGNSYVLNSDENAPCVPGYMYALGKYASELICKEAFTNTDTLLFNIRLASVCENARFVKVFVENALSNIPINITAPNQIVSFIDVRDVACALKLLIDDNAVIQGTYNLGSGEWYSIRDVASIVRNIGESKYNIPFVSIIEKDNGNNAQIGMSVDKIKSALHWYPKYGINEMIDSIYKMLTDVNGGYPQSFKIVYDL